MTIDDDKDSPLYRQSYEEYEAGKQSDREQKQALDDAMELSAPEFARLRAENEVLRGQVAAMHAALETVADQPCAASPECYSCHVRAVLADTEAAAREHDAAVLARAFEEAATFVEEFGPPRTVSQVAAALREKARTP